MVPIDASIIGVDVYHGDGGPVHTGLAKTICDGARIGTYRKQRESNEAIGQFHFGNGVGSGGGGKEVG
jgi:hypothetical protein